MKASKVLVDIAESQMLSDIQDTAVYMDTYFSPWCGIPTVIPEADTLALTSFLIAWQ